MTFAHKRNILANNIANYLLAELIIYEWKRDEMARKMKKSTATKESSTLLLSALLRGERYQNEPKTAALPEKSSERSLEFLYLSEPDMIEAGVLDIRSCTTAMEEMFLLLGQGDYLMGGPKTNSHGMMLWYPEDSDFEKMPKAGPDRRYMVMPSYLGGDFHMTGQKWYGSNIANAAKGLPRSILMFALNDADSGAPLAIMSANLLSAVRTGAVPGVAAKYLAAENASTIAIIGCGVINHACTLAIADNLTSVSKIYLHDLSQERMESFAAELAELIDAEFVFCQTLEEALADADVISIATAGKSKIKIDQQMLKPGALLTVTATAFLPDEMYFDNRVVVDLFAMHQDYLDQSKARENGIESIKEWVGTYDMLKLYDEGRLAKDKIIDLGDVVAGNVKPRENNDEIIIFLAGGLPVEDLAWGTRIYQNALAKGIGKELKIWDSPHWV